MSANIKLNNLNSQVLELSSNGSLKIPVGSTGQRPNLPAQGMIRFNKTLGFLEYTDNNYGWHPIVRYEQIDDVFMQIDAPAVRAPLDMAGFEIQNLKNPTSPDHAVTLDHQEQRLTSGNGVIKASHLDGRPSTEYVLQTELQPLAELITQLSEDFIIGHAEDYNNPHQVTRAQLGIEMLDLTADVDKPVSNATANALAGKVNLGGDTMRGNLDMGGYNLLNVGNDVGKVDWFFANEAPIGYLPADGTRRRISLYNRLALKLAELDIDRFFDPEDPEFFILPDLRGMFVRGWAPGGYSTDPGRELASYQEDDNKSHTHVVTINEGGEHNHEFRGSRISPSQNFHLDGARGFLEFFDDSTEQSGKHSHTATVNSNGTEARPKNIALLACIKY